MVRLNGANMREKLAQTLAKAGERREKNENSQKRTG